MTELLSEWMELTREERTAHKDLSTPCECEQSSGIGKRKGLTRLLSFINLTNDLPNRHDTGMVLHLCKKDSTNGFCSNPLHLYFGTQEENCADKTAEALAAGGKALAEKGAGMFDRTPEEKSEASVRGGRKGGKKGGKTRVKDLNAEGWISIIDGFVSHSGGVALHNRAIGEDPEARDQIPEELVPLLKRRTKKPLSKEAKLQERIDNAINLEIYKNHLLIEEAK